MENTLKLVGRNSNEIFTLRYPSTLLDFCEYDFSFYAQEAIEVCNEALKTGTPDFDKISEIKKDIQLAHCFLQFSSRTVYDKLVYDCWIDYVCHRDNIGNNGLWNRFVHCKTQFEKIIFQRLCDFRYRRAVNEWLNIIRIQDYAKSKVAFVFSDEISSAAKAADRRSYFDLMFSVTAKEMGCRLEDLGVTKYYSTCRTPGSPFLFPNISKEIIRHMLAGFDYSDDYSDIEDYAESSDEIAMDAFSRMKAGLPQDLASYKIPLGKMDNLSDKVYMPCGLKAAVDLEIDAIIDSGMWLGRCKRCGRFFAKSAEFNEDYCRRRNPHDGKTCLEVYEEENPRPKITQALLERCREVTDEMYSRVDKSMSAQEYNSWYAYLEAMKQKVYNGEILPSELESFLDYSQEVDISKSNPILEVAKKEPEVQRERVVRPFIPERISRSEINPYDLSVEREEPQAFEKPSREGFFTSPSVQRQKNERTQISHIIRNGEPLGEEPPAQSAGFKSFEEQYQQNRQSSPFERVEAPTPQQEKRPHNPHEHLQRLEERLEAERRALAEYQNMQKEHKEQRRISDYEREYDRDFGRDFERDNERQPYGGNLSEMASGVKSGEPKPTQRVIRSGEYPEYSREAFKAPDFGAAQPESKADFGISQPSPQTESKYEPYAQSQPTSDIWQESSPRSESLPHSEFNSELIPEPKAEPIPEPISKPKAEARPRVIRKNAAAINAYGRMAGKEMAIADPVEIQRQSAQGVDYHASAGGEERQPASSTPQISGRAEPFEEFGSAFRAERQSENGGIAPSAEHGYSESGSANNRRAYDNPAGNRPSERAANSGIGEAPSGFWMEDRGLFRNGGMPVEGEDYTHSSEREQAEPSQQAERESENELSQEPTPKRHTKSRKTQRLYDLIMREPDDNPNFHNKK